MILKDELTLLVFRNISAKGWTTWYIHHPLVSSPRAACMIRQILVPKINLGRRTNESSGQCQ